MADNRDLASLSGNVATDERTINSVTVHVQRVDEIGSTVFSTSQVVPTTTAGTLIAAREARKRVLLQNIGACNVYVGPATVTVANGMLIPPQACLTLYTTALIQAIIPTGSTGANVAVGEEYDTT